MIDIVKFKLDNSKVQGLMYSIYVLLDKLHEKNIINIFESKSGLIQTCRYTIEDAQSAIDSYKNLSDNEFEKINYLAIYGLLQALFVQQDAIRTLFICCLDNKIDFKEEFHDLFNIREIRNITTGHPTNNNKQYYLISQITLKKNKFYLVAHDSNDNKKGKEIDIYPKLLLDQEIGIIRLINRLKKELRTLRKV